MSLYEISSENYYRVEIYPIVIGSHSAPTIGRRGGKMQSLRGKRVAQTINSLEEEGIVVSESDEAMLRAYVRGTISGQDLLAHVAQFSDLSSYQDWLHGRLGESRLANATEVSVEQLVRELEIRFRRRNQAPQLEVDNARAGYGAVIALL